MTAPGITDEHLLALSSEQRAHLARRLAALAKERTRHRPARRPYLPAVLALGACVAMVPWTYMLAMTLPQRYVTHHWDTTWVGFDILLLVSFAATGVAALAGRRRGHALWAATIVTATLLCCDAWFDITTATRASLASSLLTAFAGNLPLAALMLHLGHRSLRHPANPA